MQTNHVPKSSLDGSSLAKLGWANATALLVVLLATAGLLLARIPILAHRAFDPDEFEHSHAAWCVFRGLVPYRDFFEHHTPWYYYVLAPFFRWFPVDTSFEGARHFLLFGRGLSLVLAALSIFLVVAVGRLWADRGVGVMAGLLLVGQPFFFQKTIEIRPDMLALPLFLVALWLLLRGLAEDEDGARPKLRWFLGGGLVLGAAIMCTQKMLFVLPGALAGLALWWLSAGGEGRRREAVPAPDPAAHLRGRHRVLAIAVFLLGVLVPAVLTWGAFALQHAGAEFIANNFLLNANWKHVESDQLRKLLKASRPMLLLSVVGTSAFLYRCLRSGQPRYKGLLLLCTAAGLFAGLLVVPVAQRQYYLMPLPIVCLFAAQGLFLLVKLAWPGVRPWLVLLAVIPLTAMPIRDLQAALKVGNDRQLERLHYVLDNTQPADLVMDGWEGTGVFRPHSFYYFFLHGEMVDKLPRARLDAYLDALESGQIRPKLIAMDDNLIALGQRFQRFVRTGYVRRDMPGQDQRTGPDWPKAIKKVFQKNAGSWPGFFYFSREAGD